jgi:arylsulfatase A
LYWEFPAYGFQQAVRAGEWKAVRTGVDGGESEWELYNLAADVGEQNDVAHAHPDVVRRLERLADEAHVPSNKFPLLADEVIKSADVKPKRRGKRTPGGAGG